MKKIRYSDVDHIKNKLNQEAISSGDYLYDYKIQNLKLEINQHNP